MSGELRTDLLYFGDNLEWLRQFDAFPDESVDLVYLDPPFNSNRSYNVLFKEDDARPSEAQIHAFEDSWTWDHRAEQTYNDFWMTAPEKPKQMLKAMVAALGKNDVTAYLSMMAPRLVELHRVLKPTGSLYLHCDPTASHYLKVLLDSIFEGRNFVNEIVWKRQSSHNDAAQGSRHYGRIHDVILFYSASPTASRVWAQPYRAYDQEYVDAFYRHVEPETGRRYRLSDITAPGGADPKKRNPRYEFLGVTRYWRFSEERMHKMYDEGRIVQTRPGAVPAQKRYLDEMPGMPVGTIWDDIRPVSQGSERLGYPTQKPLALLERIISASSNEGDVVLDPFCGCGTAVHAAQKLGRRWIGIDITPLATNLIRSRLEDAFPGLSVPIRGWPDDMAGAIELAAQADKYHFQDWAVIQAGGRPAGGEGRAKKGADKGVDGVVPFMDGNVPRRGIISVKAGNTSPAHIRELRGTVQADADAVFGVFICLQPPTKPMKEAAFEAGSWVSEYDGKVYPVIQVLSAQDLLDGVPVQMPGSRTALFAKAQRERTREGVQRKLGEV